MDKAYEKWSLGYWLFQRYVILINRIFHRRFMAIGLENIPSGKPVVYAPNHQNALSDALALVCSVPHQTLWLARADLFRSAIARPFLKFLKIIPVYRIRDGKETLTENDKTFEQCVSVLRKNGALGLFPEAAHSGKRQMLPHKKAIPRIVFLAEELSGFSLDIQIVPVGIFYDQYHNFGRRQMVTFGKPVAVMDYREKYLENPQQATMNLRNDIHDAILSLILNIESKTSYEGFECISSMYPEGSGTAGAGSLVTRLETGKKIAAKLNELETSNPEKTICLAKNALEYKKKLHSLGVRNWLVSKNGEKISSTILYTLFLILTFPLFVAGFLPNIIPYVILDKLIKKKVRQVVFRSTFSFAAGMFLFPLVYIIEILLISPLLPGWLYGLVLFMLFPFAGKFAFSWYIWFLKIRGRWRWLKIKLSKPELYSEIHRIKQEITTQVLP